MSYSIYEFKSRQWMILESHPQTDQVYAICREVHRTPGPKGVEYLGLTAVMRRPDLVATGRMFTQKSGGSPGN